MNFNDELICWCCKNFLPAHMDIMCKKFNNAVDNLSLRECKRNGYFEINISGRYMDDVVVKQVLIKAKNRGHKHV